MKKLSWGNLTVCCALCSAFFFADFEILDSRSMMGIRQALADPLQPPECVLGDIAGVDDPHYITVVQHQRFLDMMIGKHVTDGFQIVRHQLYCRVFFMHVKGAVGN